MSYFKGKQTESCCHRNKLLFFVKGNYDRKNATIRKQYRNSFDKFIKRKHIIKPSSFSCLIFDLVIRFKKRRITNDYIILLFDFFYKLIKTCMIAKQPVIPWGFFEIFDSLFISVFFNLKSVNLFGITSLSKH